MTILVLTWVALTISLLVFAIGKPREGGALTLSYFLVLSLIHVPGAMAYLDSSTPLMNAKETEIGFRMTLIGMAAFIAGAGFVRLTTRHAVTIPDRISSAYRQRLQKLAYSMIIGGSLSYFVIVPIVRFVPSLTALVHPLTALLIIGLCTQMYLAVVSRAAVRVVGTFAALSILPALTTVTGGFIGFGVYWAVTVVSFFFTAVRRRAWMIVLSPLVAYLGLSLFVSYMRDRSEIRELVWYEQADFGDRITQMGKTLGNFELLDLGNPNHLAAIDARLNQNYFAGLAIERHEQGFFDLEYGATVPLWAPIPRFVWPEKPDVGGGRSVVRDVTGLDLSEGTSFGAGQVLEFYVNFGVPGVIIGFFAFGALFRWLDRLTVRSLNEIDVRKLLLCSMPGFTLLQPTGNLLEMLVGTIGGLVAAYFIGMFATSRPVPQPRHI